MNETTPSDPRWVPWRVAPASGFEVDDPTGLGRIVRGTDGAPRAIVEERERGGRFRVVEFDKRLTGANLTRVVHQNIGDRAGYLRGDLHDVARHVGVVGLLEEARAQPPIR